MDDSVLERVVVNLQSTPVGRQRMLRRLWRRVYWVTTLLAFAFALVGLSDGGSIPVLVLGAVLCIALKLFEVFSGLGRADVVEAIVSRDTLVLRGANGEASLPSALLREGLLRELPDRTVLRVETRDGWRYDITLPDRATAERWLRVLRLDPAHRKARVVTDRIVLQWVFGYFFGGLFALPWLVLFSLLLKWLDLSDPFLSNQFLLAGYWFAARSVGRVDMTLGIDGVYAGRGWFRRFFPIESIERGELAPANPCSLRLVLRDGSTHDYRFADEVDARAALLRLEGVLALRATFSAAMMRVLDSTTAHTAEQWRDAFLAASRAGSYREASLTEHDLAHLITAPGMSAVQRVGAAMALRALQTDAPTRVRVDAEALAAPETVDAIARLAQSAGAAR